MIFWSHSFHLFAVISYDFFCQLRAVVGEMSNGRFVVGFSLRISGKIPLGTPRKEFSICWVFRELHCDLGIFGKGKLLMAILVESLYDLL